MSVVVDSAPTFSVAPDAADSHWGEVRDLCAAYGLTFDPWQESVLKIGLGEREDGAWAASRVGLSVPRQSGKTALFEGRELAGLLLYEEPLLIHSAHLVSTALEAFQRIKFYFENFDELRRQVKRIREGNGDWSVETMSGSRLLFKARARGSGRGFSADVLMLDEAQILGEREWAAMLPAMSARPSPQAWLAGTPPGPSDEGESFANLRKAAKSGQDKRLAWVEWSIDDPNANVADESLWWRANPGMQFGRPAFESVEDEFHSMDADTFARERLGRWDETLATRKAIQFSQWSVLAGVKPDEGRLAFGVKFTPDGSTVALAGGVRPDEGPVHVEALRQANLGEGLQWLVDFLAKRADSTSLIVVDGKSAAGAFVDALKDAGVVRRGLVVMPSLDQVVSAHSMLLEAISAGSVSHLGQVQLDEQVKDAVRRQIGKSGAFGWDPDKGDSVASLDAVTFAFWGAKVARANPGESRSAQSARRAANRRRV